jgi:hypothetical protein
MYGIDRPDVSRLIYDNQTELEGESLGDIDQETLDYIVQRAELMGVDFSDPELMGGWLKRMIKKIRARVRARRARRAQSKAAEGLPPEPQRFSLQTPGGGVTLGPSGLNVTSPLTRSITGAGRYPLTTVPPAAQTPMQAMMKNPMMLAIPLGLVALFAIMKKK